jgi:hypothetical protein
MSDVTIAAAGHQGQGTAPPMPPQGYRLWRRVRWIGYVLLGLQLAGYLAWSAILYQRYALTWDFAIYNQAWYLIAHGNLDPFITTLGYQFWRNDGEFVYYALAPLFWVFRSGMTLLWVQDLSVAGAELIAFTWLCDLARRHCPERDAAWLAGLGLLLLLVNPWLWSTVSFDVHSEPLPIVFAAFLAWDLSRGKRRAWVWAVLAMLCAAPAASYVVAAGLGGLLASRRTRRMGAAMAAVGLAYLLVLALLHGNLSAGLSMHQYKTEASGHPFRLAGIFWDERFNVIANLAPAGLLGIGAPLISPLVLAAVVPDTLYLREFAEPVFQNVPVYVFMPVGTVIVIAWLLRRHRRTASVLAGVTAAQAIGWAVIWGPQIPVQWLRVSSAQAATLASVAARIPASAEVAPSQGVAGRFSDRAFVYPFLGPQPIPVRPDTWFVLAPTSGIETFTPATTMAIIGELAGPLHARLVTHANGVWVFQLAPSPGVTTFTVPDGSAPLPAWAAAGAASVPVLDGAPSDWHMAATGAKGYVSDGMEWLENPGAYRAEVTLSVSASGLPINVEVWDDNTGTLLARRAIGQTDGIQQVVMPVVAPAGPNERAFAGWGPFRADFIPPLPGQRIEVRVWSPGGTAVNVYSAELTAASGSAIQP